jgi:hypothetical protein
MWDSGFHVGEYADDSLVVSVKYTDVSEVHTASIIRTIHRTVA